MNTVQWNIIEDGIWRNENEGRIGVLRGCELELMNPDDGAEALEEAFKNVSYE